MRFFFALAFFLCLNAGAREIQVPALTSPVMDSAGLLSASDKEDLARLAYEIFTNRGPQITVFTVPDLQGLPIEDFSIQVAEKWQLGTKEAGNGVLIIISKNDRQMRIEVGEGIEGEITDYDTAQYTRRIFPEHFRRGDFHGALRLFMEDVAGRFNIKSSSEGGYVRRAELPRKGTLFELALPLFAIAMLTSYLIARRRPVLRGALTGLSFGGISWLMLPAMGTFIFVVIGLGFLIGLIGIANLFWGLANARHRSGGFGGGGGFGGSGGGWSGGGGGFSGGGSSGSW